MSVVATEQIIIELCKETGEPGFANQQTLYGCVFDGIRDLSLHAMPCWGVTEGIVANKVNAICWPTACVKPLMTFVTRTHTDKDGNSVKRNFALAVDDSLMGTINKTPVDSNPDNDLWEFFRTDFFYDLAPYRTWNFGLGEVYGLSAGFWKTGVVTHDPSRRQSFVNGCTILSTDTFGMFYKSDSLDTCPEWVPSQAKEAIEYFALAKYYRTRNPNLGELNKKNYKEEFYRLMNWESDEGITPWLDAFHSNVMSAPKM